MSETKASLGLGLGSEHRLSSHAAHSSHQLANRRVLEPGTLILAANHKARRDSSPAEALQASLTLSLVLKVQQDLQAGVKKVNSQTLTQEYKHKGLIEDHQGHVMKTLVEVDSPARNQLEGLAIRVHLSTPVDQRRPINSHNPYCLLNQPFLRARRFSPPPL